MAIATPAMDDLAKDGVLFEHAFANASWTRASGASRMPIARVRTSTESPRAAKRAFDV